MSARNTLLADGSSGRHGIEEHPGVVDQHVEAADIPFQVPGQPLHAIRIRHIEREKPDVEPFVLQRTGGRLSPGGITRGQQHPVAAPAQLAAGLKTQPAAGAADDGD